MAESYPLVENTVGNGEIARYEQFLLFPECFQKACFPGASRAVIVWEWVNGLIPVYIVLDGWQVAISCHWTNLYSAHS